ncbi:uncharacterized protein [Branchiostoma lanceolatum]|uniref:uncharacterized protein n=1 Tax=Branchiostoma lanceolatum TaxID=7740 RepID=UPI003451B979
MNCLYTSGNLHKKCVMRSCVITTTSRSFYGRSYPTSFFNLFVDLRQNPLTMEGGNIPTRDICLRLTEDQIQTMQGFFGFWGWDWIQIPLSQDDSGELQRGEPYQQVEDSDVYISSEDESGSDESIPPPNNTASQPTASNNTASQPTASNNTASQPTSSNNTASQPTASTSSNNTASQPTASTSSNNTASQPTASTSSNNTASQPTSSNSTASQPTASTSSTSNPSSNPEDCPGCFLAPCVMEKQIRKAGMKQALLHQRPPHPNNTGVRRRKYRAVWTLINKRGGWKDERYLARKTQRMLEDGFQIVKRDVMPKCVLDAVRSFYPNPAGQPYLGHKWD